MNFRATLKMAALLAAMSAAVLTATGCGGSGSTASGSSASAQDAARIKLSQCLRQHGVNVPDNPGQGGGGRFANVDQTKLRAAMQACQKYRQAAFGTVTPAQRQAFQDAFTKFAACMRQHGVEVPARTPGSGPPVGGNQLDQNDPKVKAATAACRSNLPARGPGGARPGGQ